MTPSGKLVAAPRLNDVKKPQPLNRGSRKSGDADLKDVVVVTQDTPPDSPAAGQQTGQTDTKVDAFGRVQPSLIREPAALVSSRDAMRMVMNRSGRGKKKMAPYRANVAARYGGAGSSATFYAPVFTLKPNDTTTTESVAFATIFDEARVLGITAFVRIDGNTAIGDYSWAAVYDPVNSGAYTSVIGTLLASQHVGPICMNQSSSGTVATTPVNSTGYHRLSVKVPSAAPTAGTTVASEGVGNSWFALSDTNVVAGYLKFACDAVTGNAVSVAAMVVFHMEYRSRT